MMRALDSLGSVFSIASLVGSFLLLFFFYGRESSPSAGALSLTKVEVRPHPIRIDPSDGLRGTIPLDNLQAVLEKVKPRWRVAKPNHILHALRLWGPNSEFGEDPLNPYANGTPSGPNMLQVMLDGPAAERYGVERWPVLYFSGNRVGVHIGGGGAVAHLDQYLKVMGEMALSANTVLRPEMDRECTLEDLVQSSLQNFDIDQELEFTAVAYSRWLPPTSKWVDRYGREHSLEEIAVALLQRSPSATACCGTHTLYALVNLLRVNERYAFLTRETVEKIESRLIAVSRVLEEYQHESGAWLGRWHELNTPSSEGTWEFQGVWVTGHHLEWMAYAPSRLRPTRACIARAAEYLAKSIRGQTIPTVSNSYPAFSHAARALCLAEKVEPASLLHSGHMSPGADPGP